MTVLWLHFRPNYWLKYNHLSYKKDPLRSLFKTWAGVDCLESLALNVSTDFASMNYIHFAKVLRTLLAPRSNHWQGFALCGSHPPFSTNKKEVRTKVQPLFLKLGQGWIRTTVPSREQIYSLSPLATRPPTLIWFSTWVLKSHFYKICLWRDLNSWPLPYQGSALPLRHKGMINMFQSTESLCHKSLL